MIEQHPVFFLNLEARMRQPIGQVAVVGQEQESLAVGVEPSDGKEPRIIRHQPDNRRPALRVEGGRDDADRLMQRQVATRIARYGHLDKLAVDSDHIRVGIDTRAKLAHDASVDGNASVHDHIFGGPQRSDPCPSQYFV